MSCIRERICLSVFVWAYLSERICLRVCVLHPKHKLKRCLKQYIIWSHLWNIPDLPNIAQHKRLCQGAPWQISAFSFCSSWAAMLTGCWWDECSLSITWSFWSIGWSRSMLVCHPSNISRNPKIHCVHMCPMVFQCYSNGNRIGTISDSQQLYGLGTRP